MNDLDGTQIGRLLKGRGFLSTQEPEEADVVLINTCSVREKASQKVHSDVGRFRSLKMRRPHVVLAVTGCQAQVEGVALQRRFSYLDLVVGPDHLAKLPDLIEQVRLHPGSRSTEVGFERKSDYQFVNLLPDEDENSVRAFVTIMKGCDNFCSFCVVPYVRGREVCRPPDEVVHEVQELVRRGVREVMLLGQNVNSYGMGRHGNWISFAKLLRRLSTETEIQRIRFTTSHPKDLPQELVDEFRDNPKLALWLHLPVQSGSDAVLEKMYRGYTREFYLERLARFREVQPHIALSTDIIVGFPGETEEDFLATMDLLREVRYDSLYSFVYSPRPKTTAALYFKDDVPDDVKRERLARLQTLQESIGLEKNRSWVGKTLQVLVEGPSKQSNTLCGRSSQNHWVHFSGAEDLVGSLVDVKIEGVTPYSLLGVLHDGKH